MAPDCDARTLTGVRPRNVVDYALQRRARLSDFANGRVSALELCDAHPYLQLAAKHYGEQTAQRCPICRKARIRHVHYVYGDALGTTAGQAKSPAELGALAAHVSEFTVYVVEVCQDCGWNHLLRSFVLGSDDGQSEQLTAADG
jgi:Family of unknown function (DUF5318)